MTEEEETQYKKLSIRVRCSGNVCLEHLYISGKNIKISHPYLNSSSREIDSNLEDISKEEFEKLEESSKPAGWFG